MHNYTLGTFQATREMLALVIDTLKKGRLSYGPLCRRFESEFAREHDVDFGVLSNSGTSSLQVALQAMKELYGWADGDEVIVPALTFVATVNVVYHCKLTPVLVDIEPHFYAMNPDLLYAAVTPRTRCILPVHPFGQGADMPAIMDVAQWKGLKVIEDSCEAMKVKVGGKYVGSWGNVGVFSTYVAHIITGGIGGIGITDDPEIAARMRSLVNHGIELSSLPSGESYDPSFLARNFTFSSIGHSFRITELEAALLLPQLEDLESIVTQRRGVAATLSAYLRSYTDEIQLPATREEGQHSFMVYPMVLRQQKKHGLMSYLRENGVECRDMLPLTTQPCYDFDPSLYPVAQRINDYGLYIGCHQDITVAQMSHLRAVIANWFDDKEQLSADLRASAT